MGKGNKRMIVEDVTFQSQALEKVGPILPSFQHAQCDPAMLEEITQDCQLSVEWTSASQPKLDLEVRTETMNYRSVQSSRGQQYYNTFLAIRNKKTGKTRLTEVNETVLAPVIEYPQSHNPVLLQEVQENKTVEERMGASKHLVKSFGQAKGARFYEQQEKMRMDTSLVEDKLIKTAGEISGDKIAQAAKPAEVAIIPTRNDAAQRSDQVYLVENLLTESELKHLISSGDEVLQDWSSEEAISQAEKAKALSPLGGVIFRKFMKSSGDLGDKVGLALYMEGIIRFSKLRQGELSKGEKALPSFLPKSVKQKILSLFALTSGGRSRVVTPDMKDKAVCHIMVLALLINSLKLDASLLSESIRVRPDHLKKLVSMVGGHLVSDSVTQSQFIILKLPLSTFNMNYVGKKKGGRK